MSRRKTIINPIRAERVKALIDAEGITQGQLAEKIFQTQQNVNRIVNLKTALTEETASDIASAFPKYRIEWLLGQDDYMTQEDFERAYVKNSDIRNNALLAVMDSALREVCARDGLKEVPTLNNIPELLLIEAQLRDYAVALMSGYLHRSDSHVWSYLDSTDANKTERK